MRMQIENLSDLSKPKAPVITKYEDLTYDVGWFVDDVVQFDENLDYLLKKFTGFSFYKSLENNGISGWETYCINAKQTEAKTVVEVGLAGNCKINLKVIIPHNKNNNVSVCVFAVDEHGEPNKTILESKLQLSFQSRKAIIQKVVIPYGESVKNIFSMLEVQKAGVPTMNDNIKEWFVLLTDSCTMVVGLRDANRKQKIKFTWLDD